MILINVAFFKPYKEKTEIIKPINNDPVSPRKMLAGWKLYGKKPIKAATRVNIRIGTYVLVTVKKKKPVIALVVRAIIETPVAKPSRPSRRFTAFVMATIQIIVIGMLSQPK